MYHTQTKNKKEKQKKVDVPYYNVMRENFKTIFKSFHLEWTKTRSNHRWLPSSYADQKFYFIDFDIRQWFRKYWFCWTILTSNLKMNKCCLDLVKFILFLVNFKALVWVGCGLAACIYVLVESEKLLGFAIHPNFHPDNSTAIYFR